MRLEDLVTGAAKRGIVDFGVSDHLTTPKQFEDIDNSRAEFLTIPNSGHFHFSVEISTLSKWEIEKMESEGCGDRNFGIREGGPTDAEPSTVLTPEIYEKYGFAYVVGGVHFPLYVPWERDAVIRSYHRQNMHLATHPLITIVAHPWWFCGHWQNSDGIYDGDPWFDNFSGRIPRSMHDEFAAAVIENEKKVEINIDSFVVNPMFTDTFKRDYGDFLADLKSRGATFSIGSDCHEEQYEVNFEKAEAYLDDIGITEEDLWCYKPE
jgi:histidinol phosphatase-like PHP family hydrolase